METLALIVSLIALSASVTALIVAVRKQKTVETVTCEKVVEVVHAPVEHPFVYDEEVKSYKLDGSLYVSGFLSCLNKEGEE